MRPKPRADQVTESSGNLLWESVERNARQRAHDRRERLWHGAPWFALMLLIALCLYCLFKNL